jgi:hypothetical protein
MRKTIYSSDLVNLKEKFRIVLKGKLLEKYNRIPTAKKFTNDFNHAAGLHFSISNETGRKWISGMAIPSGPRMQILTKWLGLSLEDAMEKDDVEFTNDMHLQELFSIIKNLPPVKVNVFLNLARVLVEKNYRNYL